MTKRDITFYRGRITEGTLKDFCLPEHVELVNKAKINVGSLSFKKVRRELYRQGYSLTANAIRAALKELKL